MVLVVLLPFLPLTFLNSKLTAPPNFTGLPQTCLHFPILAFVLVAFLIHFSAVKIPSFNMQITCHLHHEGFYVSPFGSASFSYFQCISMLLIPKFSPNLMKSKQVYLTIYSVSPFGRLIDSDLIYPPPAHPPTQLS